MKISEMETIISKVRPYLINLGYLESSIKAGVEVGHGRRVDLVVYDQKGPYIAVECKSESTAIPKSEEASLLSFHPAVRQAQSYAAALNAPYFLVTNGHSFLWFTTDDSGRPLVLDGPIRPEIDKAPTPAQHTKYEVEQVLRNFRAYLFRTGEYPMGSDTAILLLAKMQGDKGNSELREALLNDVGTVSQIFAERGISITTRSHKGRLFYEEAFNILDLLNFNNVSPVDAISGIDEVFLVARMGYPRVPRWVADLMVQLSGIENSSTVLDVNNEAGEIIAAASFRLGSKSAPTAWAINRGHEGMLWTMIQLSMLGQDADTIIKENPFHNPDSFRDKISAPSHVISALPFGNQEIRDVLSVYHFASNGQGHAEELYLELAITSARPDGVVVLLVAESFLFSKNRRAARRFMLDSARLLAAISLGSGALKPFTNARSSILVLDTKVTGEPYDVFMATIDEPPVSDSLDSLSFPVVRNVYDSYVRFIKEETQPLGTQYWVVPSSKLNADQLNTSYYNTSWVSKTDEIPIEHTLHSLNLVATVIKRGSSIRLDDGGNIAVIGPACIRPMVLDTSKLGRTSEGKLPANPISTQPGDVILNNIGMYLGAAAVVDENASGSYISQHVILIRPDPSLIFPKYLAAVINSDYAKSQILQIAVGAIMPSLSVRHLVNVIIPVPDLATQQRSVDAIESAREALVAAEGVYRAAEERFNNLIQRIHEGGDGE